MKKIFIIISLILILALGYNGYHLYVKYDKINNLNDEISSREKVDEEYVNFLDSITEEVDSFDKIENKVGLLERNYNDNEELLGLLEDDLERLQKENNSVEEMIIQAEEEIKARERRRYISGNFIYSQFPKYPTGCESVALYLLLRYNGIDASIESIIDKLKKGELPYENAGVVYGGNPEIELY